MKQRLLSPRTAQILGFITLAALGLHALYSLVISPEDANQGNAVRLLYMHVPAAWLAYLSFGVTTLCSILYLIPKTRSQVYDVLAGASAKAGVIFCGLTLFLGAVWGKPIWNAYWVWDARVTATAVLFFLYVGYLAIRSLNNTVASAKRNAWLALFAFIDVPIVHFSVDWWRTLHQKGTAFNDERKAEIHGTMALSLLLGVIAFTLLYVVMIDRQYRKDAQTYNRDTNELDDAIEARRAESTAEVGA